MPNKSESRKLGAWPASSGGVQFRVWAPKADQVDVLWYGEHSSSNGAIYAMQKADRGYFEAFLSEAYVGGNYKFRLNQEREFPDPASAYQPLGPHGPSQVVRKNFEWEDEDWRGLGLEEVVIYELHVGTFTPQGSFAAIEGKLEHFKRLGINAIEIMPVAQFPGKRNWGYDGVGLFAVQNSYGEKNGAVEEFKSLVNQCHKNGIAVILDVVYNHLGPEGNYLSQYGPYFQNKYRTPWGEALNFDDEGSDEVRNFFLENARQWFEDFHIDGLRLDAVHAIFDTSAYPFLEHLGDFKRTLESKLGRRLWLIAESDANDSRLLRETECGGMGLDAQWADDLHHTIHTLLTGESQSYYEDFGDLNQFAKIYQQGVYFQGEYSLARRRSHGRSYAGIARSRLVVCSQNHDQVGNRKTGDRLIALVGAEKMKLAAACALLSPGLPLIFMGEEVGAKTPFLYFVDHTDAELLKAVSRGRKAEFAAFSWEGDVPDPALRETFTRSILNWKELEENSQARKFFEYYRRLIQVSKWIRKEAWLEEGNVKTEILSNRIAHISGYRETQSLHLYFSFSEKAHTLPLRELGKSFETVISSSDRSQLDSDRLHLDSYSAFGLMTVP